MGLKNGFVGSKGIVGSGFFLFRGMILILLRLGEIKSSSTLMSCFSSCSSIGKAKSVGSVISSRVRGL
jgi:hypothetical protein